MRVFGGAKENDVMWKNFEFERNAKSSNYNILFTFPHSSAWHNILAKCKSAILMSRLKIYATYEVHTHGHYNWIDHKRYSSSNRVNCRPIAGGNVWGKIPGRLKRTLMGMARYPTGKQISLDKSCGFATCLELKHSTSLVVTCIVGGSNFIVDIFNSCCNISIKLKCTIHEAPS